jgi:hypothetical protein
MRHSSVARSSPVRVKGRGRIEFAIWGALLGAVIGVASVPDHFSLGNLGRFIGVYAVGGGLLGLVGRLLAVAITRQDTATR